MASLAPDMAVDEESMPPEPTRVHHSGGRLGTAYGKITSPAKAERHYRTQKLRFLRMLGHATFRNGSHFAILWVSPTAQTAEVFGSEALQPKLDEWLGPRVQRQAMSCARQLNQRKAGHDLAAFGASVGRSEIFRQDGEVIDPYLDDADDQLEADETDGLNSERACAGTSARGHSAPSRLAAEPEAIQAADGPQLDQSSSVPSLTRDVSQVATGSASPDRALAKTESSSSMPATPVLRAAAESEATRAASESTTPSPKPAEPSAAPPPSSASAVTGGPVQSDLVDRQFTSAELEQWYSSRFDQLEYKVEKLVCRVWIKAIAPGKHKKFPYQDGDASKPEWWPADLRHKEPDHITKPGTKRCLLLLQPNLSDAHSPFATERLHLLVHLIRRGPGTILALEAATAANSALIPSEKSAILSSIYNVARQERKPNPADPGTSHELGFYTLLAADQPKRLQARLLGCSASLSPQRPAKLLARMWVCGAKRGRPPPPQPIRLIARAGSAPVSRTRRRVLWRRRSGTGYRRKPQSRWETATNRPKPQSQLAGTEQARRISAGISSRPIPQLRPPHLLLGQQQRPPTALKVPKPRSLPQVVRNASWSLQRGSLHRLIPSARSARGGREYRMWEVHHVGPRRDLHAAAFSPA